MGERLAAWFLAGKGITVVAGNVRVGGGEIDLLALDGGWRVAVEVRTTSAGEDPIDAIGEVKRRRVGRLGRLAGADRVDFLGIRLGSGGVEIHWLPGPG